VEPELQALMRYFPYESLRREQRKVMLAAYRAMAEGRDALIEAASGVGKTIAVLTAAMPFVEDGHRVVYLTRTHAEIDKVVEEVARMAELGHPVRAVMVRGKSGLCLNPLASGLPPGLLDEFCSLAKSVGMCSLSAAGTRLAPFNFTSRELVEACREARACPYEVLMSHLAEGDVVVMTYNYLVDGELRERVLRPAMSADKAPIVVMDEAHNVQELLHSADSVKVSLADVRRAVEVLRAELPRARLTRALASLARSLARAASLLSSGRTSVPLSVSAPLESLEAARSALAEAARARLPEGPAAVRPLLHLRSILRLLERSVREGHAVVLSREGGELRMEAFNPNPLRLRGAVRRRRALVAMSATLSSVEFYSEILGARDPIVKRVPSPYVRNAAFLIYTGLDTSFKSRGDELYESVVELISDVDAHLPSGHSMVVFVPSAEFLSELLVRGLVYRVGRAVLVNPPPGELGENVVLVSVLGGRLSEGVDLRVSLCLIVGVPYARPDYKVMAVMREYSSVFPGRARRYAYVLPAVRRAIQASGRLLRGPRDRGVVVFADRRYLRLLRYFPRWLAAHVRAVRRREELLKAVALFPYGSPRWPP